MAQTITYSARERSFGELLSPPLDDPMYQQRPGEFRTELHDRIIAPIYPFVFVLMAFAALGAPRTNRQNRNFAIAVLIVGILVVRIAGFGFSTVGARVPAAIMGQYAMLAFVCAGSFWLIAKGVIIDAPSGLLTRAKRLIARLTPARATAS